MIKSPRRYAKATVSGAFSSRRLRSIRKRNLLAGAAALWLAVSLVLVARPLTARAAVGDITTIAGGTCGGFGGDGGPATAACFQFPISLVRDATGNLYVGDYGNNRVRKINTSGTVTTIAGNGTAGYSGDGGPATAAELNGPSWVAIDTGGNLLIDDTANNVIRAVSPSGTITTVAGNGTAGYTGDGGPATSAELNGPNDVTALPGGGFLVADGNNNVVRKVDTSGKITTFAGSGTAGYSGDGGPATAAKLNGPQSEAADAAGDVYISDFGNFVVRKVNTSGIMTTFAGNGTQGYSGDGGPATSAQTSSPVGLTVHGQAVYFTDYSNNAVREVDATGTITSVPVGSLFHPQGLLFDPSGNLIVADVLNGRIQQIAGIGNNLLALTGGGPAQVGSAAAYAYTFTIRNPGDVGGATGVALSDTLPAGVSFVNATTSQGGPCTANAGTISCPIGSMPVGASVSVTINVTAPNASVSLSNSATVTANPADQVTADNTVTTTTLVDAADVSVTANASPSSVVFGNPVTFALTVQNAGAATATNVVLTNALTAGIPVQSTSASQGSCATAAATVTCGLGTLAKGGSATVSIVVVPPQSATSATDNAAVSADQIDPNTANNSATATAGVALTTFSEFPVGRFESPQALAFGTDGKLYVAESTFDREITQLNTNGDITNRFSVTAYDENFVTRGPDGNIWFTESNLSYGPGFIGRLTPSGALTEFPLPSPFSRPYAIAAGGDGNVWFTEDASAIGRITPQGVITEFAIPTQQPLVDAIALGPDGNVWFTESRTDKVARIDPQGHITEFDLPSGAGPEGLVTGPDHNLWIVESGSNNIATFNVSTHALTEFPIPTPNSEAEYIAVGPDGNLYFTEADFFNYALNQSQGIIGRMSTSGAMLEIPIPNSSRDEPWGITAGPDGKIWFVEQFGHEVVSMAPPTNVAGTQEKGTSSIVHVSAHQAPPIPQLNLPQSFGGPLQSTRGVDGNLYTYSQGTSAIGRISPGGKFTSIPAPAPSVGTMATGSDGNIWYCDNNNGVNRFNPTTGVTNNFPTPSPYDCHDVVAGADGALWYDNPGAGVFGKMTTSGVATEFPLNLTVYGGPGKTIWTTSNNNFERLNADGSVAASYPIPSQLVAGNMNLIGTTGGPDGNLWFTAEAQDPTLGGPYFGIVGRLNVITGKIDVFRTGIRGSSTQIQQITSAPDGNLYAAFGGNQTGPAGILVMNTSGQILSKQLVPAGFATPNAITVGPSFLSTNKNGWAVYMTETATGQFAVIQGNGG